MYGAVIGTKNACNKGVATETRKKVFLTTEAGHREKDGIDTSCTKSTLWLSCIVFLHGADKDML